MPPYESCASVLEVRTKRDRYNQVSFDPVTTQSIRIEVRQQTGMSSGILECKINGELLKFGQLGTVGGDDVTLPFDYPKTRLSLARLADAVEDAEQKALVEALTHLDSLAESLLAARARIKQGDQAAIAEWKQLGAEMAAIEQQFAVDEIPSRLNELSAERRLELMIQLDWLDQDRADQSGSSFRPLAVAAVDELGDPDPLAEELRRLTPSASPTDPRWMDLYLRACAQRRAPADGPPRSQVPSHRLHPSSRHRRPALRLHRRRFRFALQRQ